jgi:hypothetical protein
MEGSAIRAVRSIAVYVVCESFSVPLGPSRAPFPPHSRPPHSPPFLWIFQIHRDAENKITGVDAELNLAGDVKKTEKKVTWIAAAADAVPLKLVDFDFLINVPKLEESDDFFTVVNKSTKFETVATGEPAMRSLKAGDIIQLERKG